MLSEQRELVCLINVDEDVLQLMPVIARAHGLGVIECRSFDDYHDSVDKDLICCVVVHAEQCVSISNVVGPHQRIPLIMIAREGSISCAVCAASSSHFVLLQRPLIGHDLNAHIGRFLSLHRSRQTAYRTLGDLRPRLESLTPREHEVMILLASGRSTKQIAHDLRISPKTADVHRYRVLEKLAMDSPAELAFNVASLIEHELVDSHPSPKPCRTPEPVETKQKVPNCRVEWPTSHLGQNDARQLNAIG